MPITPQRFDIDAIKADFLQAATVIKRDGISSLLDYLEKSDFYSAPASEKNGVRAPTARSFSTSMELKLRARGATDTIFTILLEPSEKNS